MVGCFAGARIMRATHVQGGCCNTCAVLDDGRLFCWGEDYAGELGDGAINGGSPQPQQVVLPEAVVDLSLGPSTNQIFSAPSSPTENSLRACSRPASSATTGPSTSPR